MNANARPTAVEIDARIANLTTLVDRLGNDLYDLENNNPTRIVLATTPLSGRTEDLAAEANDHVTLLWALYGPAREALDRVIEQRGSRPNLSRQDVDQLDQLLSSAMVDVTPDTMELGKRLLTHGTALTRPARLDLVVDIMSWVFQQVTAQLAEVTALWDEVLPRPDVGETALSDAEQAARATADRVPNEIAVGRQALEELRTRARTDPLSIDLSVLDGFDDHVARSRAAVAEASASHLGRDALTQEVNARLDHLDHLVAATERTQRETAEKIRSPADFGDELGRLRSELAEVRTEWTASLALPDDSQRRARVARADRRTNELLDQLQPLHMSAGAQLADRDELRGRLDAYRAKARSLGRGEDVELDELYEQVSDELYQAPCDLAEAHRVIERYQQAVNRSERRADL